MATREEAEAVHINVMRDEELQEIQERESKAAPGAWHVWQDNVLMRFDKTPVDDAASLLFAARARQDVPRLLKCVRTWEDAWRAQSASAKSWKQEYVRQKDRHEQDLARAAKHESGPEYEPDELIECVRLGVIGVRLLKMRLIEWSRGASVMTDLRFALEDARKKEQESIERMARRVAEDSVEHDRRKAALDQEAAAIAGGSKRRSRRA